MLDTVLGKLARQHDPNVLVGFDHADDAGVYQLTPTGTLTVLHAFSGAPNNGSGPMAGLVFDKSGNLYGTTYNGGTNNRGTVLKVTP